MAQRDDWDTSSDEILNNFDEEQWVPEEWTNKPPHPKEVISLLSEDEEEDPCAVSTSPFYEYDPEFVRISDKGDQPPKTTAEEAGLYFHCRKLLCQEEAHLQGRHCGEEYCLVHNCWVIRDEARAGRTYYPVAPVTSWLTDEDCHRLKVQCFDDECERLECVALRIAHRYISLFCHQ